MSKKVVIMILLCIILIGALLRFYNITNKGFFISDESFFAMVAKTLATTPKVLLDGFLYHRENLGGFVKEQLWWGAQHTTARPGFIFPVAILMMILGTHDYVPFVFNALLGTLTILLVYLIAIAIFKSEKVALTASFLLAISNYHIFYSRTGLAQITTGFFLTLAILLYLRTLTPSNSPYSPINRGIGGERTPSSAQGGSASGGNSPCSPDFIGGTGGECGGWKKLFITGIALGYLLSTHQSIIPMIGFIFLFDLIFVSKTIKEKIFRLLLMASGVVFVMAFWELILGARKLIAGLFNLSENVHTYLEELGFLFWNNIGGWPANPDKLFYFDLLKRFDGWLIIALLFIGGLVFFLKKDWHDKKVTLLFALTWFILIFWSFVGLKATRTMAMFTPILALFSAYSLVGLFFWIKNKVCKISLIIFFAGLIFILNLGTAWQILNLKSGYKEVANYLENKNLNIKETDAVGMGWLHYDFYLNQKFEAPHSLRNPHYLISDWGDKDSWHEFSRAGRLVAAFPNPIGSFYPAIKDIYYGISNEETEEISKIGGIDKIGIFSVK